MAALRRKERPATEELYARYASRIFGLGLVLLKNEADAEDLVQDTFLKVWRTGAAFDPRRGSLDTWILLNARSLAINLLRRRTVEARKLSSQPSGSEVSEEPGPEWHAELGDLIRRARKAMDRLPPGQRSALELAYFGQRSSTEVAALQRIPPGTVKSRIRAGIGTLRRTLVEGLEPPDGRSARTGRRHRGVGKGGVMRRIRVEKPRVRRDRSWLEVLPLDSRDPDVVRAKRIDRSGDRQIDRTRE